MTPSAVLALLASLAFGSSDFLAALVSRRISSVAVALWSQLSGAVALVAVLAVSGQRPDASGILWGVAAGATVAVGILSLYRALAIGPASVVAPVSASAVVIPVLVGILGGETPSPIVVLGLAVTVGGVALVSFAGGEADDVVAAPSPGHGLAPEVNVHSGPGARLALSLALLTALCFGSFFVILDRGTASAGGRCSGWRSGYTPARCRRRSPQRSSPGTPAGCGCRRPACWRPWHSWVYSPSSGTSP